MTSILIVDDEIMLRNVIRKMLERGGYEVFEASDGLQGSDAYRRLRTDIVITDIVMPNKDGIQLIAELKRDFPDVRLIAMSGGGRISDIDFLDLAKQFGAACVLTKPFTRKELYDAIHLVDPNAGGGRD